MTTPLRIGLAGLGNIGTGVMRHLASHGDLINSRLPRPLQVTAVCVRDKAKKREVPLDNIKLTDHYDELTSDPDIDLIIELIGGTGAANDVVRAALSSGKHVVTANKALIARYGAELFDLAAENGAHLLFEASVGAGIPLVRALQMGIQANRINGLYGILNGTCNFILSTMEDQPERSFRSVLEDAMRLGYAEPDPTLDIEGNDAAHKIAILGSLTFDADLREGDVSRCGITAIDAVDVHYALDNGLTIKLLAMAVPDEPGGVPGLSVWPTFVPREHPIGQIHGVTNCLWVDAEPIGPTMYSGPGAGQGSTSSGVLSDVMLIAAAGDAEHLRNLNPLRFGYNRPKVDPADALFPERYLRIPTDRPEELKSAFSLRVLHEREGTVALLAPPQTGREREELLGKLSGLGYDLKQICEIRYALQTITA